MKINNTIAMFALLTTGSAQAATTIFSDNFDAAITSEPANVLASASNPSSGTWFQKDVDNVPANSNAQHWSTEDHNGSGSTLSTGIDDFNVSGDGDLEMRLGFGFDEVRILLDTGVTFDLSQDYTLSADWEIIDALANELGFYVGIAEFSAAGELLNTIGLDLGVGTVDPGHNFGDLSGSIVGDAGNFSLTVTAADLMGAGVAADSTVGIYFHHDDNGTLGSDAGFGTANASDVYVVDNVLLTAVPEPSSLALLGLGGLALTLRRRR